VRPTTGSSPWRPGATRHYEEEALAGLMLAIANINVWNRFNVATRQVAGQEW
jgi:alkylhydroperoxidase family enzyme